MWGHLHGPHGVTQVQVHKLVMSNLSVHFHLKWKKAVLGQLEKEKKKQNKAKQPRLPLQSPFSVLWEAECSNFKGLNFRSFRLQELRVPRSTPVVDTGGQIQ